MKLKSGEAELVTATTATSGSTAPSPVQPHNNSDNAADSPPAIEVEGDCGFVYRGNLDGFASGLERRSRDNEDMSVDKHDLVEEVKA